MNSKTSIKNIIKYNIKKTTVVKRKPFASTTAPAIVGPTKFPNENPDSHKPKIIKSSTSSIIKSGAPKKLPKKFILF